MKFRHLLGLLGLGTTLLFVASAVQSKPAAEIKAVSQIPAPRKPSAWVAEKWTGDKRKYQEIRVSIDQKVRQKGTAEEKLKQFLPETKDFYDPLAQFRWAYAVYALYGQSSDATALKLKSEAIKNLKEADRKNPPRNVEYSRLRFLLETNVIGPSGDYAPLGERLVKANPQDYQVRFSWGRCMAQSHKHSRQSRLSNAQVLIEKFPTSIPAHKLLAGVYKDEAAAVKYSDPAKLQRAISAYEKIKSLSAPNQPDYKSAQATINRMKRMKEWYSKNPTR